MLRVLVWIFIAAVTYPFMQAIIISLIREPGKGGAITFGYILLLFYLLVGIIYAYHRKYKRQKDEITKTE